MDRKTFRQSFAGISLAAAICLVSSVSAEAWETTLHTFEGAPDGMTPYNALIANSDGTLFGAARYGGGKAPCSGAGCGTVFMLKPALVGSPSGAIPKLTIIHQFDGVASGFGPSGLVSDGEGGLYGITYDGGYRTSDCHSGCGIVYRLAPPLKDSTKWRQTVLYRFKGGRDGEYPNFNLVMDKDGALYGVTNSGGGNEGCAQWSYPPSCGVVFQLKPLNATKTIWAETVLHRFKGTDGGIPVGGLTIDPATGTLYGSTWVGGDDGNGTIFRLQPPRRGGQTWRFTTLYNFKDQQDGWGPNGALAFRKGTIYGAAGDGGEFHQGVVFQLTPPANGGGPWIETTLYAAKFGAGTEPAGVTLAADGSLYVPAFLGGDTSCRASGCGTIFKLLPPADGSKNWRFVSLHRFKGTDGDAPYAALTLVGHHAFGVTQQGGDLSACGGAGCGVLFDVGP